MTEKRELYPHYSDLLFKELKEIRERDEVLRWSLRDVLGQSGIPTNPDWSDEEIVAGIADKLGVEHKYSQINEAVRGTAVNEENPQNSGE